MITDPNDTSQLTTEESITATLITATTLKIATPNTTGKPLYLTLTVDNSVHT